MREERRGYIREENKLKLINIYILYENKRYIYIYTKRRIIYKRGLLIRGEKKLQEKRRENARDCTWAPFSGRYQGSKTITEYCVESWTRISRDVIVVRPVNVM